MVDDGLVPTCGGLPQGIPAVQGGFAGGEGSWVVRGFMHCVSEVNLDSKFSA